MMSKVKASRYSWPSGPVHVMNVDGGGGIAPHTYLNLVRLGGNSIMPGSVYPWDRETQYPVNRLGGGGGSRADIGIFEEEKNVNEMRQNVVRFM
jgi:hypothetical protein